LANVSLRKNGEQYECRLGPAEDFGSSQLAEVALGRQIPGYPTDMPNPWTFALRMIPWKSLLSNGPAIAAAADALLSSTKTRKAHVAAAIEGIRDLSERVAELERHDRDEAELGKQISVQLAALTQATEVLAARQRWLLVLATTALAVGLLAVVLARI
jgi:hypothetical protein